VVDNARVLLMAMRKPNLRNQQEQARPTHDYSPQPVATGPPIRHASARASYPVFLSLHDTLKLQFGWAWRGLMDASRWDVVVSLITRNVCFPPALFLLWLMYVLYFKSCAAMPRSGPMRSSRSCSMASHSYRSMCLNSSCTPCREWRTARTQGMGFIRASGGFIASCGCCPSLAYLSISTCVV
jgi:hypothetical protein